MPHILLFFFFFASRLWGDSRENRSQPHNKQTRAFWMALLACFTCSPLRSCELPPWQCSSSDAPCSQGCHRSISSPCPSRTPRSLRPPD
uniref:Secreted peptide n=1 Tax=Anopheles braziliensis TaxID=58242 RepID=A0A2M3ZLL0_9DIPT